jgi:hypothetical protein
VNVPIQGLGPGQKVEVNFPPRCIYCGRPAQTQVLVDVSGGRQTKYKSVSYSTKLLLPYCLDDAIVNHRYKRLMMVIGIPLFLIIFVGWFFLMMPFSALVKDLPGNIILVPLIFPCIGNGILAFAAIVLLHGILLLVFPKFRKIPFISEDGALGVTVKMHASMMGVSGLEFSFTNKDYAADFAQLNGVHPDTG